MTELVTPTDVTKVEARPHQGKNRYLDPHRKEWTFKILPGEYHANDKGETIVTTLGSCISACIRDMRTGIGGMNHFMLPEASGDATDWAGVSASARFGNHAMEMLINDIIKLGGNKKHFEAKLFGGALMGGAETGMRIGDQNIRFAREYLRTENIMVTATDVGGNCARKVYFNPKDGKVTVKQMTLLNNDTIQQREKNYSSELKKPEIVSSGGDVDLF